MCIILSMVFVILCLFFVVFLLRIRRPPISTRTETPFPFTTLFRSLVVLVAGDGVVENRGIDIPAVLPPSALVEAGNYISAMLGGLTLAEAQSRVDRKSTRLNSSH